MLLLEIIQITLIFFYIYQISNILFDITNTLIHLQERVNASNAVHPQFNYINNEATVEQQPTFVVPDTVTQTLRNNMNATCTICTEDLVDNLTVTHCGHIFHTECINNWQNQTGQQRANCPNCRASLNRDMMNRTSNNENQTSNSNGVQQVILDVMAFNPQETDSDSTRRRYNLSRILNEEDIESLFRSFL